MYNKVTLAKETKSTSNEINFDSIKVELSSYLQLDFDYDFMTEIILATAVSIELDYPVWIMIIAPPSTGKTEMLNILKADKYFHSITCLTNKFFFSGDERSQGGYMNRIVKNKGLLAFPDFTTVTSLEHRKRKEIFNHLRIIHDGRAGLGSGIDTGDINYWEGKVAVVACVTESINKIKDTENDLGDRFIYYNNKFWRKTKSFHFQRNLTGRKKVQKIVKKFLDQRRKKLTSINISSTQKEFLIDVCKFISHARTPVIRNGYSREIIEVHQPEGIHRLLNAIEGLFKCLLCVNGDESRSRRIIRQVAFASIPASRYQVISIFVSSRKESLYLDDITKRIPVSVTKTRRDVEDLVAIKVLHCDKHKDANLNEYEFNPNFQQLWSKCIA